MIDKRFEVFSSAKLYLTWTLTNIFIISKWPFISEVDKSLKGNRESFDIKKNVNKYPDVVSK